MGNLEYNPDSLIRRIEGLYFLTDLLKFKMEVLASDYNDLVYKSSLSYIPSVSERLKEIDSTINKIRTRYLSALKDRELLEKMLESTHLIFSGKAIKI